MLDTGRKQMSPSPDSYDKSKTFGNNKGSVHYTFSPRQERSGLRVDKFDNAHYNREKKLPGPGYYHTPDVVG